MEMRQDNHSEEWRFLPLTSVLLLLNVLSLTPSSESEAKNNVVQNPENHRNESGGG